MHQNEKVAATHHEFVHPSKVAPGEPSGYIEKEYKHREYPKHVTVGERTVEVKNAEEEAALFASSADATENAAAQQVPQLGAGADPESAE